MQAVEQFYDDDPNEEWQRLERHRTEFAVTMRALAEFLPPAPATILDMGSGPGRNSIALAQRGYSVTLADLSQQNLALAREQAAAAQVQLADIVPANVLDLAAFVPQAYDAVLVLGPLYHLLTEGDRQQVVREVLRLIKSGGTFFAAFITRFAPFRNVATSDPMFLVNEQARVEQILTTGVEDQGTGFTNVHFAHPAEVQPLMEGCGLKTIQLIGCEVVVSEVEGRPTNFKAMHGKHGLISIIAWAKIRRCMTRQIMCCTLGESSNKC
jgi:2-polyprenyl-3-methyl-5-hydroxy-6-metoxy-1,4-benzoquinol methylase